MVTNALGANLPPGLAAALAAVAPDAAAALEVDEAWLGRVVDATTPRAVALLNLSRDQLDRNNEVRQLATAWRRTFWPAGPGTVVVANADDPLVVWGAGGRTRRALGGRRPAVDPGRGGLPGCGGRIRFGDGGAWSCRQCDLRRPAPRRAPRDTRRSSVPTGSGSPCTSACPAGPTGPTPPWP